MIKSDSSSSVAIETKAFGYGQTFVSIVHYTTKME